MTPTIGALIGLLIGTGIVLVLTQLTHARDTTPQDTGPSSRPPTKAKLRAAAARGRFTRKQRTTLYIAAGAGVLIAVTTGWWVAIFALPALAITVPLVLFPPRNNQIEVLEGLEDWTRRLASLFAVGQHLNETLAASLRSCPPTIEPSVRRLVTRLQARQPAPEALYAFADDINDEVGDQVATTLIRGATESGGPLGSILTDLADMVAEQVHVRRQIAVAQSTPRGEAKIITVLALTVISGLLLFSSYGDFYSSPTGQIWLAILATSLTGSMLWMNRIATPPPSPRFLVRPGDTRQLQRNAS